LLADHQADGCGPHVENRWFMGHPFMTSKRRGVKLRWAHVDGRMGSSPMWTDIHIKN